MKKITAVLISSILAGCGSSSSDDSNGTETLQSTVYTVNASSTEGATVSPTSVQVTSGQTTSFTLSIEDNYEVESAVGCNGSLDGNIYTTGTVDAACDVAVTLKLKEFSIATLISGSGSISPEPQLVPAGSSATYTIAPDEGYELANISGCGGELNGMEYTIAPVSEDCTLDVTFATNDGVAPTAQIVYPMTSIAKSIYGDSIIRGVASDADGIKEISIGGENVDILHIDSLVDLPKSVVWQATLSADTNHDIRVKTVDAAGNTDDTAATLVIVNEQVQASSNFALDTNANRLINHETGDEFSTIDLNNYSESKFVADRLFAGGAFRYAASDDLLYYPQTHNLELNLYSVSVADGTSAKLGSYSLGLDSASWNDLKVNDIELTDSTAYMLLQAVSSENYDDTKSIIVSFDRTNNTFTTVMDDVELNNQKVFISDLSVNGDGLLFVNAVNDNEEDSLSLLNFVNGEKSTVSDNIGLDLVRGLEYSEADKTTYVIDKSSIFKVDNTTQTSEKVYSDETGTPFLNTRSKALNSNDDSLLIYSDSIGLNKFNLVTNELTAILNGAIGEGQSLYNVRAAELDKESHKLYLLTVTDYMNSAIVAVDLNTGTRSKVVEVNSFGEEAEPQGFAFDAVANNFFVAINNKIFKYNEEAKTSSVIFDAATAEDVIESAYSPIYDNKNQVLYFIDNITKSIVKLNKDGSEPVVVSSSGEQATGSGVEINSMSSMTIDAENGLLYVASQLNRNIITVDAVSGSRELLTATCAGTELEDTGLLNVKFNSFDNTLLLDQTNQRIFDLATNECTENGGASAHVYLPFSEEQMLFITTDSVLQKDLANGNFMVISK